MVAKRKPLRPINRLISKQLTAAREAADLTKSDMAKKLKMSRPGYHPWEEGEHRFFVDELEDLSKLLGRSPDYFLGREKATQNPDLDAITSMFEHIRDERKREMAKRLLQSLVEQQLAEDQARESSAEGRGNGSGARSRTETEA